MKIRSLTLEGSTLVVTLSVVATLLVLLGTAVEYTTQVSRNTQRSRKTALAMEIADGHLETLFTSWRNIYKTTFTTYTTSYQGTGGTDYSLLPTNYFFTSQYNPGPAPSPIAFMSPSGTPPIIPLPSPSNFPTEGNYTVTQYRIQAVNPMIELDANENAVDVNGAALSRSLVAPASYGPNDWQYSYYYLAAVDVTVPTLKGNVTAKVRRIFEKKFDNPFTYAMFYVDDLELQPTAPFSLTGPVHTNANLYIGTSNFSVPGPSWPNNPSSGRVEYGSEYINGYSPYDGQHTAGITAPNFAKSDPAMSISDMPPTQVSAYLPFGWNVNLSTASGTGSNNDSYHEIIERPSSGTDAIAGIRYYSQRPYVVDTQDLTASPPYAGKPGQSCRVLINEHYWKFANATARNSAGTYTTADVGKVSWESGIPGTSLAGYGTYWTLTSLSGTTPTWTIIPERTTYAFLNATARTTKSYTPADVGKTAYQYDNDSYWKITAVSGPTATWSAQIAVGPNPSSATWISATSLNYSSAANRKNASGLVAADVGKIAYETDDGSFWRLDSMKNPAGAYSLSWVSALQVDTVTMYVWKDSGGTLVATAMTPSNVGADGKKGAFTTYDKIFFSLMTTSTAINDARENGLVRLTSLDVSGFAALAAPSSPELPDFSGVLYIADMGAKSQPPSGTPIPGNPVETSVGGTTESAVVRRGIKLRNGATLQAKLTIVSDNPIYIQGDFNTGVNPPSNSGTYTSPTASGYTRWASAIIGDAIYVLSNNWVDANSINSRPQRVATNTTVNAALVSGNTPSGSGGLSNSYSGGGENYVRFLEDWSKNGNIFCYYGSMVQMYTSQQATGAWTGSGNQYAAPVLKWYWDVNLSYDARGAAPSDAHWGSPPGNLQIAAYLQQQRWYQVY